ncbi:hypothetical protein ACJIZ3_015155 [Penstemon smallii]|uniref:Lipase n=1 Tax=Penstemon smallii TaxID=265156 RepID=A0ABD3RLP5_9LAMI
MASKSYFDLIVMFIVFVSLVPHLVFGSSRSHFLPNKASGSPVTRMYGICATAVTVHGYTCQEYDVTTDDGYILSGQRITAGLAEGNGLNRQPVVLQHGLFVDGMTWLMNSPQQSLAMILADNGFDVWISNLRGTRYSRRHVFLHSLHPQFWDWTWDELVTHDLQSVIEYVYGQTGQKIHYVGHSMGTLIALASLSEGLQIDKIKSAALLSPIAYLSHVTVPFSGARGPPVITSIEYNPSGVDANNYFKIVCANPALNCFDFLTAFTGKNCCLNQSIIEFYLDNEPQSTSTRNLDHFGQMTTSNDVLSKYDFEGFNILRYGQLQPPTYDLTKIPTNFPLFLSYGGQDKLSVPQDVITLLDKLKLHDKDKLKVQYIEEYAHLDFIIGVNAKDIVYNQVIQFFRSHN